MTSWILRKKNQSFWRNIKMLKNSSRKSINKPRKFEGPINFIYTEILKISSHIDLFLFFHIFICIFSFYICLWWTWPLFLMYDSTIHLCLRHQWFLILAWDPHNILQIRQGTAPLVKSTEMFEWCSALCHVWLLKSSNSFYVHTPPLGTIRSHFLKGQQKDGNRI